MPFWLKEFRKKVTAYEGIPDHDEPHKVCGSMNSFARVFEEPPKVRGSMKPWQGCVRSWGRKERICILHNAIISIYPGASQMYTFCYWVHLHYPCISDCLYLERLILYMLYYDVVNLMTVTKMYMINGMPCGCGSLRTTAVVVYSYRVHS